ncbi:uncharacterized protein RAG0_07587 [Rhynchosporium agropyri]|uniref:Uncharacterized protein n=1 Tax=Rhynchosporium agropyri TaxID=914238 RepID=A0A1E1KMA7_9HELO|nr:uncharacterized protein RAG0_07587 [Rhynchosporium agropyri]
MCMAGENTSDWRRATERGQLSHRVGEICSASGIQRTGDDNTMYGISGTPTSSTALCGGNWSELRCLPPSLGGSSKSNGNGDLLDDEKLDVMHHLCG